MFFHHFWHTVRWISRRFFLKRIEHCVCSVHFYQCVSFQDILDDWSNFDGTFKYVHIRADYLLKSFHLPVLILTEVLLNSYAWNLIYENFREKQSSLCSFNLDWVILMITLCDGLCILHCASWVQLPVYFSKVIFFFSKSCIAERSAHFVFIIIIPPRHIYTMCTFLNFFTEQSAVVFWMYPSCDVKNKRKSWLHLGCLKISLVLIF